MKRLFSHRWLGMLFIVWLTGCVQLAVAMGFQLASLPNSPQTNSVSSAGDSRSAVIDSSGRYVLFMSRTDNLVSTNRTGVVATFLPHPDNVFLRDRTNGTISLVSVNLAGAGGNGTSFPLSISDDGRYVLFESQASDLVPGDTNQASDVFVRDLATSTTRLVSTTGNGSGNGPSGDAVMTPDGRYVAFVSAATNLVAGDTNGIPDVFVRDLTGETTTRVSVGALGKLPATSDSPVISPDGRYVVFGSTATNLVAGVTNASDLYMRDLVAGVTTWVTTNTRSLVSPTIFCKDNQISDDGQFVVYEAASKALSFASSTVNGFVFRQNLWTGQTDMIYTNAYFSEGGLAMTPDGRFVTFLANTNDGICALLWDAQSGTNRLVSGTSGGDVAPGIVVDSLGMDATGAHIAFVSNETNDLRAGHWHAYVHDVQAGTTALVDETTNGFGAGICFAAIPALSRDGRYVAFESASDQLVANDGNQRNDVFVRDLTAGTTELISVHDPALPSQTPSGVIGVYNFSANTNAHFIAFSSDAANLVAGDTNLQRDVFLRDMQLGTNLLVSVNTNGIFAGNGDSSEPSISADGRYVAFTSWASDLVAGDTNKAGDVFVRDLSAGTTVRVSADKSGQGFGNNSSYTPTISADGRYVLFHSLANNLSPGTFTSGTENLFLRDRVLNTNYALSTGGVIGGDMTPDGRFVLYVYNQSGLKYASIFDSQLAIRIYTNTIFVLLPWIAISPNGQHIAYMFDSSTLDVIDRGANTNWLLAVGTLKTGAKPRFSTDGRYLAYVNASSGTQNIAVFDTQTGTNTIVSRGFNPAEITDGNSYSPDISADGRWVSFASDAGNLVPGDLNHARDVFVCDWAAGVTLLLSVNQSNNSAANNWSLAPRFSSDGKAMVFSSLASDLVDQDFNQSSDLFTYRLPSSTFVDADHDGMDDSWELDHFQTLARDGTGDFDADGATDLFEFQTGTDPKDPTSLFKGQLLLTPGAKMTLSWAAAPGRSYTVQFKNDLSDADWQDLNGNISLLGTQGTMLLSSLSEHGFYRILLKPVSP